MDQQLIAYYYNYDKKDVSATILTKDFTFVTDVKGLTTWYNSKYDCYLFYCAFENEQI